MTNSKSALSMLTEQIIEDLLDSPNGSQVRCAIIPDWFVSHVSGQLIISGPAVNNSSPNYPSWLGYSFDGDSFTITLPMEPFLFEGLTLLFEVWRNQNNDSSKTCEEHLRLALANLAQRWKSTNEPLSPEQQMGVIGELLCIQAAYQIVGTVAIESWDPEGRALYDLEAESWIIEAKATRNDPEKVRISNPRQVDYRIPKELILGVTRMNAVEKNGQFFPQIVEGIINNFHLTDKQKIRLGLSTRGYSSTFADKFRSQWVIHYTKFIPITKETPVLPCDLIDSLPDTVSKITYNLETASLKFDDDLTNLLSR